MLKVSSRPSAGHLCFLPKLLAVWLACLAFAMPTAENAVAEVTANDVENGISKACGYLRRVQRPNGGWAGHEHYGGGMTALATLALINSQLPENDRAVEKAMSHLRTVRPTKTYEVSLMVMAFCYHRPAQDMARIRELVEWLRAHQAGSDGGWDYPDNSFENSDPSNSQFAALALWEAQRVGVDVPAANLMGIVEYWNRLQIDVENGLNPANRSSGGWRYRGNTPATGSMTCAGIASLLMAEEAAKVSDAQVVDGRLVCCRDDKRQVRTAEMGMHALSEIFSISTNPGEGSWWLYYLYALERVGRLTGQRLIAGHDWYREGCELILQRQNRQQGLIIDKGGVIVGNFNGGAMQDTILSTSLALLFLSKGKREIVMARVQLPEDGADIDGRFTFRRHTHAVNHLCGHVETAWKRDLAWQSLDLSRSQLRDLLETPVLFFSGSEPVRMNDQTKQLLYDYVQQGGTIFVEARNGNGCDATQFEETFIRDLEDTFEQPFKKLPTSHPVWNAEVPVDIERLPKDFWLYGMEACCRTAVIYCPISLACRWELSRPYGQKARVPAPIQAELDEAVAVGLNVITYATGRQLKKRLAAPTIIPDELDDTDLLRGAIRMPRMANGGVDDTPQAVPHLLQAMKDATTTLVDTDSPMLPPGNDQFKIAGIAYLHGREAFEYSDQDQRDLREFLVNGGFLLGDAICGSNAFAEAFESQVAAAVPEGRWEDVPLNDPMLTPEYGGFDIRTVTRVDPGGGGQRESQDAPVLRRYILEDRSVAIFSPLDLSCSLESQGTTQCPGYSREDAARIGINMIFYALQP